jgi:type I restriction-modification system DNA methylase subunit
LIVSSPKKIYLYPGFRFEYGPDPGPDSGALRVLTDFNRVATDLDAFSAEAIDSGKTWYEMASAVRAEGRVDWRLLGNLRDLEKELHSSGLDNRSLIHSVIGKFVYLRYLRDRKILSDRKLEAWKLDESSTLGRAVDPDAFSNLLDHLDDWLNGSVFPLTKDQVREFGIGRLRRVAGIFRGDESTGQMALDFANYDFSFIPIETLSVIYEQFLHMPDDSSPEETKGRQQGAYYTPIPVVNYMIDCLARKSPLRLGMRVLDVACGSGAFLVQTYRRLIEAQYKDGVPPKPLEAREILIKSIYGVDIDPDACRIAELSLVLTLLDYVDPPDLEAPRLRRFLPSLAGRNICRGDAFDDEMFSRAFGDTGFDWILGNPPWKDLRAGREEGEVALRWADDHRAEHPIGGLQAAELFAWRSLQFLDSDGVAGLLLPAMTLFKSESIAFRQQFFAKAAVWSIANFANLVNVLFGRRSTVPAMALFFSRAGSDSAEERIEFYAPFLANQPTLRKAQSAKRRESWNLLVNASELTEVRYSDALRGDSLEWKIATWGSFLDRRLLGRLSGRMLSSLEEDRLVVISQGLETRTETQDSDEDPLEHHPELAGRKRLNVRPLKRQRHLMRFPNSAIEILPEDETWVRKRGGFDLPYRVSQSPHVIVSASLSFAVYDEGSLLVPPRQIGIAADRATPDLMRALALYLNSDFATYHQFFTTPEAGIQKTRNTLASLRNLPVPFDEHSSLEEWQELFDRAVAAPRNRNDLGDPGVIQQINNLTAHVLGLDDRERALIEDFVRVRLTLTRGKVTESAIRKPTEREVEEYAQTLRDELDAFIGGELGAFHSVAVASQLRTGVVEVGLTRGKSTPQPVKIRHTKADIDHEYALALKHLSDADSQWTYFRRDLQIYTGSTTYFFKPFERMHWTRTQAILDASELLAEMVMPEPATEPGRA